MFDKTVKGFAGQLDDADWERLKACMPHDIASEEDDKAVVKLEGKPNPIWLGKGADPSIVSSFAGGEQLDYKQINPDIVKSYDTHEVPYELWSLDRVDQTDLPLDGSFDPQYTGKGVTIYVVDSGIRTSHQEFSDVSTRTVEHGWDFVEDDGDVSDCDGHGSHVAGTAAGRGVGVAKDANIVGVRILVRYWLGAQSGCRSRFASWFSRPLCRHRTVPSAHHAAPSLALRVPSLDVLPPELRWGREGL